MVKSIIKETFIMLLLCIAIILILGILFYDYIPTNKVIPQKEAYTTPENVRIEINEQITEVNSETITYEITDSDLNIYKQTSSYKPGKKDPFSLSAEIVNNNVVGNTNINDDIEEGTIKNDADKNSTGTFFDDEGIK